MIIPLFLIPILAGLTAQALKPLLNRRYYSPLKVAGHAIPRYGGMPSAHTAFAVSLVTVVGINDGIFSTSFAIAATILFYTLDDALRMRMFLGRFGQSLRLLISEEPPERQKQFPYVESRLGHKPLEVAAGAALGVLIPLLLMLVL